MQRRGAAAGPAAGAFAQDGVSFHCVSTRRPSRALPTSGRGVGGGFRQLRSPQVTRYVAWRLSHKRASWQSSFLCLNTGKDTKAGARVFIFATDPGRSLKDGGYSFLGRRGAGVVGLGRGVSADGGGGARAGGPLCNAGHSQQQISSFPPPARGPAYYWPFRGLGPSSRLS